MSIGPYVPQFLQESEFCTYGLTDKGVQPDIVNLVQFASAMIDEYCGRLDGDGNGSLAYTTYESRIMVPTRNRNLFRVPHKPMVALGSSVIANLQSQAEALSVTGANTVYTGCVASTYYSPFDPAILSPIVSASGRYSYARQDTAIAYPESSAMLNPMSMVTMFGGPASWVDIGVAQIDYDKRTGECWPPAGIQLNRYTEILIKWNAGFDPLNMHPTVKLVTAALVKNLLAKGGGTTGLISMTLGRGVNAGLVQSAIDPTLQQMLTPFCSVRAL